MSEKYDVIIIGGGHNGLTSACCLAKKGRRVLVLERRDVLGGIAAGEEFYPGYHTTGLLHETNTVNRSVVEQLGLDKHGLKFASEIPPNFVPTDREPGLLLWHDPKKAKAEIEKHSAKDASRYAEYRAFLNRIQDFMNGLLVGLPADLGKMDFGQYLRVAKKGLALRRLGKKDMLEILRINVMCVADWLDEWFEYEPLKAALAATAIHGTFTGPRSPGSTANLILAECAAAKPVAGGPRALIDALEKAARSHGVEIRTGNAVSGIRIANGKAEGVVCQNGEAFDARVVMASCDPKHCFLQLVESRHLQYELEHEIHNWRARGTTAKLNVALEGPLSFASRPDLRATHIRIGDHPDYLERAFDPVKYGEFSGQPCLDIHVPTVENPDLAPSGHHVVSILVHFAPYHLRAGWTDSTRQALADNVLAVLETYAPGTRKRIVSKEVLTPLDLEERYGLTQGHIHHGEHALDQLLARPARECGQYATPIPGLYLCGSGSSPGGGITCLPGKLAADAVSGRA